MSTVTTETKTKKAHHSRRKKKQVAAVNGSTSHAPATEDEVDVGQVEIIWGVEKPPSDIDPALEEVFNRLGRIKAEGEEENGTSSGLLSTDNVVDDILESLTEELGRDPSKKELKKKTRPTVAQLKQIVSRPAVVEVHDVTSPDPEALVFLKSRRNTVPVPRHWSSSTRFLSGKRASDKKPYQLPEYIANTGIGKLREASDDANNTLQQRQRERARPKLGRIEIDYQVLYDAFFKYQTKPRLTKHGELYFEGKELEKDYSKFLPGTLSDELRLALGMPIASKDGQHAADTCPPPWLGNMQRVGPPPSYPNIKYPGVNAPLPAGAQYGPGSGQWGKPPLDQFGRGLYGDVMGAPVQQEIKSEAPVKLWGALSSSGADEEESASRKRVRMEREEEDNVVTEDEDEEEIEKIEAPAPVRPTIVEPLPPSNLVPEEAVDLRKKPTQAFKVLEKQAMQTSTTTDVFGASHKYAIGADKGVTVAIAPEALESGALESKKELEKLHDEERQRSKVAFGLAPGAGHLDVAAEMELAKKAAASSKDKKSKPKREVKF